MRWTAKRWQGMHLRWDALRTTSCIPCNMGPKAGAEWALLLEEAGTSPLYTWMLSFT